MAKLLFIMKMPRPYLDTAMSFLINRVSKSNVGDGGKSRRIIRFVHCILKEKSSFGATNINEIFTWVDASYAVHYDMRSHTGGAMSMGLGVTH